MTVEEFLNKIGWNRVFYNKEIDKYRLKFEYSEEQGNNTHYVSEFVFKINIDHKTKTITFEG